MLPSRLCLPEGVQPSIRKRMQEKERDPIYLCGCTQSKVGLMCRIGLNAERSTEML